MHAPIFIPFTSTSKIANILKKIQDFNGVWTRDLAITGAMLYQLSYEATDVGSRSVVGSYVPVKDGDVLPGSPNPEPDKNSISYTDSF